ncbi:uncharacterized protein LOC108812952 isoform X2 [Raphanus sativus]|uniref:Uncharacterized protein LOC108812952 isoform X2 n=1 Tax=Raphanus sativus TaxID=3726 RepID=A0A9W3BUW4_RAPSA|nr:uncharacterized protein LOC108812952 isoform X2 [Raphanus sativus]
MKMDKKLSVVELLKLAAKLLLSNINLTLFIFLCSLPLFCFLIFFELSLQTTLSFTYQFLSKQVNAEKDFSENDLCLQTTNYLLTYQSFYQQRNIWEDLSENDLIRWLIKTSLLYFFPYTILDLLTTTTIVAASSTVYTSKEEPLGLLDLVQRSIKICQKRLVAHPNIASPQDDFWNDLLKVMVLEEQEWASFDRQRVDRQRERIARADWSMDVPCLVGPGKG